MIRLLAYSPRRTILDKLLVDAASEAGAEIRESFIVDDLLFDGDRVSGIRGHSKGGEPVTENARVVVGADGVHFARRARRVGGTVQRQTTASIQLLHVPGAGWRWMDISRRTTEALGRSRCWPTNDDLTLVIVGWPIAEFEANKADIEGHYLRACALAPALMDRMAAARREERFIGAAVPNYFRKPFGPAGHWSAMPATTRTSSRRRASPTRFATPSALPPRSTTRSREPLPSTKRWERISQPATRTSCQPTSSRVSSRGLRRRRSRCNSFSPRFTATRRR